MSLILPQRGRVRQAGGVAISEFALADSDFQDTNAGSWTRTVTLGTAAAAGEKRYFLIAMESYSDDDPSSTHAGSTTLTLNGTSATSMVTGFYDFGTYQINNSLWYVRLDAGGGDVSLAFNPPLTHYGYGLGMWRLRFDDAGTFGVLDTDSVSGTTAGLSISNLACQVDSPVVFASATANSGSTIAWTGDPTEDWDHDIQTSEICSGASLTASATLHSATATVSSAPAAHCLIGASINLT